jgi:hypothetical protein
VLLKLAAGAVVLGIIPVALISVGGLPSGPREDLVPYETRTVGAEEQWRERVGAICKWELKQGKAFNRAFRRAAAPVDVVFMFKSLIRLNDESMAIFARLEAPLEFRRESKDLLRYLRQQRAGLAGALRAFRDRRRPAFIQSVRRLAKAEAKIGGLLVQLGVNSCGLKPVTVPGPSRVRIV